MMSEKEKEELYSIMEDMLNVSDKFAGYHNLSNADSFELLKMAVFMKKMNDIESRVENIDCSLDIMLDILKDK